MKFYHPLIILFAALLGIGCSHTEKNAGEPGKAGNASKPVDIRTERLDARLWDNAPADSALMGLWTQMAGTSSPAEVKASAMFTMFEPEVLKVFPAKVNPLDGLNNLGDRWNKVMPIPFPIKRAATVVLPKMQQVVVSDSVLFVVLNHYLGAQHPAYNGFPEYKRVMKTSARILPDVAEALTALNFPDKSQNLMQAMMYQGALVEAVMQLTGLSEQQVLGYTDRQMAEADKMQDKVWNDLIKRKLLLSTDPTVIAQMIEPAPATALVSPDAPGRLGRFIGHRLVNPTGKKPLESLATLLSPDYYTNPEVVRNPR